MISSIGINLRLHLDSLSMGPAEELGDKDLMRDFKLLGCAAVASLASMLRKLQELHNSRSGGPVDV